MVGQRISVRAAQAQSALVPVDARVLLAHVLGVDHAWLVAHALEPLSRAQADTFFALAKRRRDGEPVAYLTGTREFWGLCLAVTPAVLIPRPETEALVETALARLPADRPTSVLDIGTGCGAIALAIARERPLARLTATDLSSAALDVARGNAVRLGIGNVEFKLSDVYSEIAAPTIDSSEGGFDLIASNPPYVAVGDPHLAEGDLRFEPAAALASGRDGLDVLKRVIAGAWPRLGDGGALVVEHGHTQSEVVRALFATAGFTDIVAVRDLAGIPRVVAGRTPSVDCASGIRTLSRTDLR
jgi:release factor glutamine methyltransferase